MMMEKDKEENVRTPLDKMTASTVNHARKLSKRLRQIQQGEVLSNGCDKNVDSDAGDYLTLVVSDEIADTEQADKTSKLDAGKYNQKDFRGSFDGGFPKSPSGRITKYISGKLSLRKLLPNPKSRHLGWP